MIFGDILAVSGLFVSTAVFIGLAFGARTDHIKVEEYLLDSHGATSREFGPSFAAASTSLATVIIFFIATSQLYGPVLFWCGATYLAGQTLFLHIVKGANLDTSALTTNADFWRKFSLAPRSSLFIGILTITSFMLILFVELYIGSVIVSYYLSGIGGGGKAIAFAVLGIVVIAYVRLGGLRVVFKTDGWQLRLMVASMAALLLCAMVSVPSNDTSQISLPSLWQFSATHIEIFLFCAWIAILNFTLPFTQLSSWQRVAAVKSPSEAWTGLIKTIPHFLIIWMVPVVALMILNSKGFSFTTLPQLFDTMRDSGGLVSSLLYPMVFVGFASALFSTADSAMIALQLAISDNSTFGNALRRKNDHQLRRFLLYFTLILVFLLSLIFGLAEANIGSWFIPLVFAIFSQLSVAAPQLLYGLIKTKKGIFERPMSKAGDWANFVGLFIGWAILIVVTVLRAKNILPSQGSQEIATYIAVAVSAIGLFAGIKLSNKQEETKEKE